MALKDMVGYIQDEVHKEVDDQVNNAKIQSTQSLIALGEELEHQQEEKIAHVNSQLKKREEMLKAEQDFIFSSKRLNSENEFVDILSEDIKNSLIDYTQKNPKEYQQILSSWFKKVIEALQTKKINIIHSSTDKEVLQKILADSSIEGSINISPRVSAGFIAQTEDGVIVDLSFETLFAERKQQLLNIAMQIVKENS